MTAGQQNKPVLAGWLDNNREEQYKIKEWLRILQTREALDELGVGTIQEAFSDKLFPGITTNQRRAKYLVILPYLLKETLDKTVSDAAQYLEKEQKKLVGRFPKNTKGVIGIRNPDTENKPLSIYWSALKTFLLVNPELSRGEMCNLIMESVKEKKQQRTRSNGSKFDDNEYSDDDPVALLGFPTITWDYHNWREGLRMELTRSEAEFLADRIREYVPNSALAQLLEYYHNLKKRNPKDSDFAHIPENLRFEKIPESALNNEIKYIFQLAKDYQDFIFGANLAYNYLLSNRTDNLVKKVYNEWKKKGYWRKPGFNQNRIIEILNNSGAKERSIIDVQSFLIKLYGYAKADKWGAFEKCVENRESELKRNRKKIGSPDNMYKEFEKIKDVYNLKPSFRWGRSKTILNDILKKLK